jgi:hypothetical protein
MMRDGLDLHGHWKLQHKASMYEYFLTPFFSGDGKRRND